jgi:hypothetical protein
MSVNSNIKQNVENVESTQEKDPSQKLKLIRRDIDISTYDKFKTHDQLRKILKSKLQENEIPYKIEEANINDDWVLMKEENDLCIRIMDANFTEKQISLEIYPLGDTSIFIQDTFDTIADLLQTGKMKTLKETEINIYELFTRGL